MLTEHSILLLIWNTFWLLAPALIYLDATRHHIGKIKGDKSFVNMSAGFWAALTLAIGLIGLPFYLFSRSYLIDKAKANPVHVSMSQRIIVASIYLALGVGAAVMVMTGKMHQKFTDLGI